MIDINQLADADGVEGAPEAAPGPLGGPLPPGTATAVAKADPTKPAGPGEDLEDAIRDRAGSEDGGAVEGEPAAAGPTKNLPKVPPTGAVTSALGAVRGSAKGCVAGADEPSTATVTFGSSGAVQSVVVGGWAAGRSAASCVKSAMMAARVPAFANPSYTTSVTIRP